MHKDVVCKILLQLNFGCLSFKIGAFWTGPLTLDSDINTDLIFFGIPQSEPI